jgi:hypothetical protein
MAPYGTRQEPRCHSPPSSQRRTRQWGGCLHVRHVTDLVAALVLIAQWCQAPIDALVVLKQDADIPSKPTPKMCTRTDLTQINIKVEDSLGRRGGTPLVPWGTLCCGSARRRCSSCEPSSTPWRPCTMRPELGPISPSTQRPNGPVLERLDEAVAEADVSDPWSSVIADDVRETRLGSRCG